MFEWIENYMEAFGCDWETAAREYDYQHNPDYCAEDYDCDYDWCDYDCGFDPYLGCYTDDC